MEDDVLVKEETQRIGVLRNPRFQITLAQAPIGNRLVETHHQVRLGNDRQMLQCDVRQVPLANPLSHEDFAVERGMIPRANKKLAKSSFRDHRHQFPEG